MKLFEIGKNIKTLKVDNGLTQQELADKSGISRVTLGRLERGLVVSISVKTLDLILYNLGFEIEFKNKEGFGLPTLDEI